MTSIQLSAYRLVRFQQMRRHEQLVVPIGATGVDHLRPGCFKYRPVTVGKRERGQDDGDHDRQ